MRFGFAQTVAACLLAATAVHADEAAPVRYTLTPVMEQGGLKSVAVEIAFAGEADGETWLRLPGEWGGEQQLWKSIVDLKADGATVEPDEGGNQAVRLLRHAPNAPLVVHYRVIQDWPGEPAPGKNTYRAVIQPGYFHLIGHAAFATPDWNYETPATFEIANLPHGWRFASDLEHAKRGRKLTIGDVTESVSVAGDFRVVARPGLGGNLRVAIRGTWRFTDDGIADKIAAIVDSHQKFWGDGPEPFLVTILPLTARAGSTSLGGTGLSDAFAFFATDNGEEATINRILAHEHLHTWIPRRLGGMPEKDEARDYWLSEGFTDFYTSRLLVRDGIWKIEDFAAATNEILRDYATSPVRTAPNTNIVADFWNDAPTQKLPYQRGQLLAAMWDHKLRAQSKGRLDFDDVVLRMRADARHGLTARDNFNASMKALGLDPKADIAKHIDKGEPIVLPAAIFAPCGKVETVDVAEFDRGFDRDKTQAAGGVFAGVDPAGPAYKAGLRDGMKLIKREAGIIGDSRVEIAYRVDDNGTQRLIKYMPAGKGTFTLQEFKLTPGLDQAARAACAAHLGGATLPAT